MSEKYSAGLLAEVGPPLPARRLAWRRPPSVNLERFALSRIFPGGADYAGTPEVRAPTAQARHPASAPGFDLRHFDTAWKGGGGRTVERPLNKDGKQPEPKCAIANSAHSLQIKIGFPHFRNLSKTLYKLGKLRSGAGGGTRTHTTFYGPRILSPVRLPFRHTGNLMFAVLSVSLNDGSVDVVLLLQHANQFNFKQLDQPR